MSWNVTMPDAEWLTADSGHDRIQQFINRCRHDRILAIDTETTGLNYMRDVPLFWSLAGRHGGQWRACLRADLLPFFKDIFEDPDRIWTFANAKYDAHILYNVGVQLKGTWHDTAVMHFMLHEDRPHGLKEMVAEILEWKWQDFKQTFGTVNKNDPNDSIQHRLLAAEKNDLQKLVEYASNDAYGTLELYYRLRETLEETPTYSLYPQLYPTLWAYFDKIEAPFTKVLWKCERAGEYIDQDYIAKIDNPVQEDIRRLLRDITHEAGMLINPNSTGQLREYFFVKKGYRPTRRTDTGAPSTDFEVIEELAAVDPVARLLMDFRDLEKLYKTYVRGIQKSMDRWGRVHTHYNQASARTGRLSSSDLNL